MELETYLRFVLALAAVLAAIWGLAFLVRRFGLGGRLAGGGKGRRLAVVEFVQVDSKRRLALVRRDGVEHLILLGQTSDLLIESAIPAPPGAALADTAGGSSR